MIFVHWVLLLALQVAFAAPQQSARKLPKELQQLLKRGGWMPTPSNSARYQIGDVFLMDKTTEIASGKECFSQLPEGQPMADIEVARYLKAGFQIPLGKFVGGAKGKRYKRFTYADTAVYEFSKMALQERLTEKCKVFLESEMRQLSQPEKLMIIKAVIQSTVNEQVCTSFDASLQVPGLAGGTAGKGDKCEFDAEAPVTIAYQLMPVSDLYADGRKQQLVAGRTPPSEPQKQGLMVFHCTRGFNGGGFVGSCTDGTFNGLMHMGIYSKIDGDFHGLMQISFHNSTNNFSGLIQEGVWNVVHGEMRGMQLGLFNSADQVNGFQLGFINKARVLKGLQLGVLNVATENKIPFMLGINFGM